VSSPTAVLLDPDAVVLDLLAESSDAAVRGLHQRLSIQRPDAIVDSARFLDDVFARMRLAPVCIAGDIALPHARTDSVSRVVLAVARTAKPIAFDAEHPAVRFVFLMGTPKSAVAEYLAAVAALTRQLRQSTVRAALEQARDEAAFRAALSSGVAAPR
jgi:mannitol/fructose-specific phosphotransferase system IIA component (Ntr-type)